MKQIKLSQGRVALVDDKDFEWLSQWNWHYSRDKTKKTGYAMRHNNSNLKRPLIQIHIAIMKRYKRWRKGKQVDHINTCGCDNRKENLRLATSSGQKINVRLRTNNTSGVTGIYWNRNAGKWHARIKTNGKQKHLGYFISIEEAIKARLKAEIKYFGEFQYDPTNVCPLGYTGECLECAQRLKELYAA